jgi:creatinine deaminase
MLVLARMRDESIIIGDDITVTVADIRGDKVRLGIAAPRHVSVHRKEVYEQIKRENKSAAGLQPGDVSAAVKPPVRAGNGPAPAASSSPPPVEMRGFMRTAIDEARRSLAGGGIPIGAVLVRNNQIIGRGCDERVQRGDPTAHAVIECLRQAGRQGTYRDTVLYTTLTPDHLAAGAAVQVGIPQVIVGAKSPAAADSPRNASFDLVDLHDAECVEMVETSKREHPERWRGAM